MYSAEKKADGHDKLEYVSSRKVTIEEDGINVKKRKKVGNAPVRLYGSCATLLYYSPMFRMKCDMYYS